jgi:amino acid adenylation domain-containing protein
VAAQYGDKTALIAGERQMSYRALADRSAALAARLGAAGVRQGVAVAIAAPRGMEAVVAMLGVLCAGGAYVPVDPDHPDAVLRQIYAECAVALTLCAGDAQAIAARVPGPVLSIDAASSPAAAFPAPAPGPDDLAYVMYTSGSTGQPKGVLVPHRGILRLVVDCDYARLGPQEVVLQAAPLSFDAATFEIFGALLNGGTLALVDTAQPSLRDIAGVIARCRVTTAWFTAGLFNLMVEQQLDALRPLRQILAGGDVLSPPHVARVLAVLADGCVINGYGPTENTTFTCCHRIGRGEPVPDPIPIGKPIRGTTVQILDDALRPVPDGQEGELYTGGAGLALGYVARPDLTAERFVTDPRDGATLYKTGDRGCRLEDGTVLFRGRADRQVKVNGKRVELDAVEAGLRATGLVAEAAAIAPLDRMGHRRIRAFVSPTAGVPVSPAAIKARLASAVPDFMVPSEIVVLDALPLNGSGKVDRARLAQAEEHVAPAAPITAARSQAQAVLSGIWCQVLGRQSVGAEENFFDLGGTSMQLLEAHGLLEAALARPVPLMTLFDRPAIQSLAEWIDGAGAGPVPQEQASRQDARMASRRAAIARARGTRLGAGA